MLKIILMKILKEHVKINTEAMHFQSFHNLRTRCVPYSEDWGGIMQIIVADMNE